MAAQLAATEREREAADAARRDLIAAVSHDLRTPLTSLRLLAEAIEDGVVDQATAAGYRRQMSTHIASLSHLVDDLFELSRLEAGEIGWSMQRVALDELVAGDGRGHAPAGRGPQRGGAGARSTAASPPPTPTPRRSSACCST